MLGEIGIAAAIALAGTAVWLWRKRQSSSDKPPDGIVLLLAHPKPLNLQSLAVLLSRVSGTSVRAVVPDQPPAENENAPAGDMVAGAAPHFLAFIGGSPYAIHTLSHPYMPNPLKVSESFNELRLRKAVAEHKAWLSVDRIDVRDDGPKDYGFAAKVVAELIGPECLALYHPPLNLFSPCDFESTPERLRSSDPISAVFKEMTIVPVVEIGDDPRMRAAEAEARARFPEFRAAFDTRSGSDFTVKAVVATDTNKEHIWIEVEGIEGDLIHGRLGNEPVDLEDLRIGSKVSIPISEVEDWVYFRDEQTVGLFTPKIFELIATERSKA